MTKLGVSYPPAPPRKRRERVLAKALRVLWSALWWSLALAAALCAVAALGR